MFYIFIKLLSESLLSFYPAMVKFIKFPIINQVWARFIIYTIISFLFIKWGNVLQKIFSLYGLLLGIVNTIHVFSSYKGFEILHSGVAYSLFYTYPFFILLFSGILSYKYIVPFIGIILLCFSSWKNQNKKNVIIGIISIIISALSETGLYFIVKKMNEKNNFLILFLSYFLPTIILSAILHKNVIPKEEFKKKSKLILLLVGNAIIGFFGYFFRFYTIPKLKTNVYSITSFFGIIMAYIYGWLLNKEKISWEQILGSLLIISSAFFIL